MSVTAGRTQNPIRKKKNPGHTHCSGHTSTCEHPGHIHCSTPPSGRHVQHCALQQAPFLRVGGDRVRALRHMAASGRAGHLQMPNECSYRLLPLWSRRLLIQLDRDLMPTTVKAQQREILLKRTVLRHVDRPRCGGLFHSVLVPLDCHQHLRTHT